MINQCYLPSLNRFNLAFEKDIFTHPERVNKNQQICRVIIQNVHKKFFAVCIQIVWLGFSIVFISQLVLSFSKFLSFDTIHIYVNGIQI